MINYTVPHENHRVIAITEEKSDVGKHFRATIHIPLIIQTWETGTISRFGSPPCKSLVEVQRTTTLWGDGNTPMKALENLFYGNGKFGTALLAKAFLVQEEDL